MPVAEIFPELADHVLPTLLVLVTVAVNCLLAPAITVAVPGVTAIVTAAVGVVVWEPA